MFLFEGFFHNFVIVKIFQIFNRQNSCVQNTYYNIIYIYLYS